MHVFHVNASMIHSSETPLQLEKVFALSDGYRMAVAILSSGLHLFCQGVNEAVIISIQMRYLLSSASDLTVKIRKILVHSNIISSLGFIGA